MRRLVILVALVVLIPTTARADGRGPCLGMDMRHTVICASKLWNVDTDTALYVAERESGFYAGATSPSGTYLGIFQIGSYHMPAWPDAVMSQPWFERWFPNVSYSDPASLHNGRFNIFLTMRMVHAAGWGPWT